MSEYEVYLGIDPGLDGALASIQSYLTAVYRTPTLKVGSRRQYRIQEMVHLVKREGHAGHTLAILEKVHSMPGQGVASAFSFGHGCGLWEGILAALGIPYLLVAPQTWKAAILRDMPKDKNASKQLASQLFPYAAPSLGDVPRSRYSDGEAEALLIAEYGRRLHGKA